MVDEYIRSIDTYFKGEKNSPFIVNFENILDLQEAIAHFEVDGNTIVKTSTLANKDNLPSLDNVLSNCDNITGQIFVTEYSSFLKLRGHNSLIETFRILLHHNKKLVIFTYKCERQLREILNTDLRHRNNIYFHCGKYELEKTIVFVTNNLRIDDVKILPGINYIAPEIEKSTEEKIYIYTAKSKDIYRNSLLEIVELNNAYNILCQKDLSFSKLSENLGSTSQWETLLSVFEDSIIATINKRFGDYSKLETFLVNYSNATIDDKWLYFISLKFCGSKNNSYLQQVIENTNSQDDLIPMLFKKILEMSYFDKTFNKAYQERKNILKLLGANEYIIKFCQLINTKNRDGAYYLTDCSREEKELIFSLFEKYEYSQDELNNISKIVYPDLATYLLPFEFRIDLLKQYFSLYKYSKVINKISPKLYEIMIDQAKKRDYNILLEPRCSVFDKINKANTQVYFIDALGVEYLSFIQAKCVELGLLANINIAHANIPTITSINKEFTTEIEVVSIKELDEIKHAGTIDYDYQKTKLPIHLIKELEIIQQILISIQRKLNNGEFEKIVIVSDHGASRLAVIYNNENIYKMSEKGIHSGRCCSKTQVTETDIKYDFIIESDDYFVLTNYDRFQGSRRANVEVHGGATLEEIVVPIIELTTANNNFEIEIITEEITISFRKQASIKLYISKKLDDICVCIDGQYFQAIMSDDYVYDILIPSIKKAKTYKVDVYQAKNKIATDLSFIVRKEVSQEKDLF
ncbi:hypothetical protein AN641_04450 [Candidatus Epulonipiscioides gigas]|nr:hypothetical protein AN641_04450 [Epulopiscium sp. SCG-C07WGA-EpuloA2]